MYPPLFQVCAASPAVTALLGPDPIRLYAFGDAPQDELRPYAVWQQVTGYPENYIGDIPDIDRYTIQIDAYAGDGDTARSVAEVLRDAIEPAAHVVGWRGEGRDPDTRMYRYSFDVEWFVPR